jgi:hypothetical protein
MHGPSGQRSQLRSRRHAPQVADMQQEHRAPQAPRDRSRTTRVDSLRDTVPAVAPVRGVQVVLVLVRPSAYEHPHQGQQRLTSQMLAPGQRLSVGDHTFRQSTAHFRVQASAQLQNPGKSNEITRRQRKWKAQRRAKLFCVRVRRSVGQSPCTPSQRTWITHRPQTTDLSGT